MTSSNATSDDNAPLQKTISTCRHNKKLETLWDAKSVYSYNFETESGWKTSTTLGMRH